MTVNLRITMCLASPELMVGAVFLLVDVCYSDVTLTFMLAQFQSCLRRGNVLNKDATMSDIAFSARLVSDKALKRRCIVLFLSVDTL